MRKALGGTVGTMLIGAVLAACVPSGGAGGGTTTTAAPVTAAPTTAAPTTAAPTTVPSGPVAPVVDAFAATVASAPSPLTTALTWTVHDANGDTLTCQLDLDTNGTYDVTVNNCAGAGSRTRTFTTVGVTTVTLAVSDASSTTTATTTVTVTPASGDAYAMTLRITGSPTTNQSNAFTAAAAKWAGIVKTGQPDLLLDFGADYCASGMPAFSGTVDDLLIDAQIVPIDGPGRVLGSAGPCLVRNSNGIPVYGIMKFDSADVANLEASGQLADTIVHEMGHILGIGTVWSSQLLLNPGTSNPTFAGAAALGRWRELGGTGNIPVENSGGGGTADAHWRETTFRTELMTGYLNSTNQLSALTAASLADLGYGVTLDGVDSYLLPSLMAGSFRADSAEEHFELDLIRPKGGV